MKHSLIGQKFDRLTVQAYAGTNKYRARCWECLCVCGTRVVVPGSRLTMRGKPTRSCGCLAKDINTARKGAASPNFRHGSITHPEYALWCGMIQRCTNPNNRSYKNYGGRGITICKEWRESFATFLHDVGPRPTPDHTLERLNNEKGYEPDNIAWRTRKVQRYNRRDEVTIYHFNGQAMSLPGWAQALGMRYGTLWARLHDYHWPIEKVLSIPRQKNQHG